MVHPFARPASPCCVFVLFLLSSVVFVPAQAVAVDGNRPPLRRLVLQDKLKAENRRLLVENKRLETFLEREQHNRVTAFAELPTKLPAPVVAPGIDKTDKVLCETSMLVDVEACKSEFDTCVKDMVKSTFQKLTARAIRRAAEDSIRNSTNSTDGDDALLKEKDEFLTPLKRKEMFARENEAPRNFMSLQANSKIPPPR